MANKTSFWLIYYWLKILGLNPLSLSKNKKLVFSYLSVVYGCCLAPLHFCMTYLMAVERSILLMPGETPLGVIVDYMIMIINVLEYSSTWLIFGFHQNCLKFIVKSFVRAEKMSTQLGIPENYEDHFRKLGIKLTVVTILFLVWGATNNVGKFDNDDFKFFLWMSYFVSRVVSYNSVTLFIWSLIVVKRKFHRLNDKLRFMLRNNGAITNETDNFNYTLFSDRLNIISQLHRELRDLVHRIQQHYALPVLFNILTQLFLIAEDLHIMYRYLRQQDWIKEPNIIYLGSLNAWILVPLFLLFIISNVCDSTVKEANETGNILHTMVNACDNFDFSRQSATFKIISFDLLQNRVRLSLLGFFDLDSSLVYDTIATAVMYLVIMLQFYG